MHSVVVMLRGRPQKQDIQTLVQCKQSYRVVMYLWECYKVVSKDWVSRTQSAAVLLHYKQSCRVLMYDSERYDAASIIGCRTNTQGTAWAVFCSLSKNGIDAHIHSHTHTHTQREREREEGRGREREHESDGQCLAAVPLVDWNMGSPDFGIVEDLLCGHCPLQRDVL